MDFHQVIRHCLRCGGKNLPEDPSRSFRCEECSFPYFINSATAVVGIVTDERGRILLIRRARDPGRGKWSAPGGFVDPGESAEDALRREMREEVGLELTSIAYLCSFPDPYEYKGVVYPVLDLIFVCETESLDSLDSLEDSDEVEGHRFLAPEAIDPEEIAFPSVRRALEVYRRGLAQD
ncbi:MAG: NUDIX domain-containing protein [Armatimonadetes bacterium]|nr:NUDIX domain-containing protein [Armatimonadota bacterium]